MYAYRQSFDAIMKCFIYIKNKFQVFQKPGGVFIDIGSVSWI